MLEHKNTGKVLNLINTISTQFRYRTETEGKKSGQSFGIIFTSWIKDDTLWLRFSNNTEICNINIPIPFIRNGVTLIKQNEILRALCPFWLEEEQQELDYIAIIYKIILGQPTGFVKSELIKATPYLQRMIYGFKNNNATIICYKLQQAINEVVNKMPLHETTMNSYVMNNRLMVIDDKFDRITNPNERLDYQVTKARKYFSKGWTSVGLSDGTLADKNYILKIDLRKLSPFGIMYHNPQRNLYSTLAMKGDEYPIIRSKMSKDLLDKGITRKGWNLFTAFVDIPDVFEDQIMVDESLASKFVEYETKQQIFGYVKVKEQQPIKTGQIIGIAPDGENVVFNTTCESAFVSKISKSSVSVGGRATKVYNVVITYRRYFKDGFKITNLHGNKGVVRLTKLGYAIDPRTGKKRKIDIIVGAQTIGKRRNYGQILEVLVNCILEADASPVDRARMKLGVIKTLETKSIVIPDEWTQTEEEIENGLVKHGFNRNGTWSCNTYAGKLNAVCGNVFWGVIKTPEDQVWKYNDTIKRNSKELRTAGLKFSHVEFRAIETRFGKNSALLDEIMSYAQGAENLKELLNMASSKIGNFPKGKQTLNVTDIKAVDQHIGTIVPGQYISGTIVDEFFCPNGFMLKLPLPYTTLVSENRETFEGSPKVFDQMSVEERKMYKKAFTTDKLYIPHGTLRKCWRHETGKYGLSEVGVLINNVVIMSKRLITNYNDPINHRLYYASIYNLFKRLSLMLGSKNGEIATHGMAIRYPFSVKAVACLTNTLPKNTIEIHRNMSKTLGINNGDVVITERFPCLGFMSVRPQKVRITDDPMCKYVIRVSGNSLVSQNLDFDGDVIFLASFHNKEAKKELINEWSNPNKTCYDCIKQLNGRKGAPHTKEYTLSNFNIKSFNALTNDEHAMIIEKNVGVKAQTGPVVALTYNIMRIIENSRLVTDHKTKVGIEMFLEKTAQSVFEQKHGGESLHKTVIKGICTTDVELLVGVGFKRSTTEKLCSLIREKAASIGIFDLQKFYEGSKSNIISKIVSLYNKIYFASRATLEITELIEFLSEPAVDIPSEMFKWIMSGKVNNLNTKLDDMIENKMLSKLKDEKFKTTASILFKAVENSLSKGDFYNSNTIKCVREKLIKSMKITRNKAFGYGICVEDKNEVKI